MNQNKIKEICLDYKNSLDRLKESLGEDITISSTIVDGTIQRFEFTFELAWKMLRIVLLDQGLETNAPKAAIKESFRVGIIKDGDGWIEMLEDRNKTSHTYDQKLAKEIYEKIKKSHIKLLEALAKDVKV